MHVGRIAHPANQPSGARIVGPSAIAAKGSMWTDANGMQPMPVPEALSGELVTPAADQYSLATIAYNLVCGCLPVLMSVARSMIRLPCACRWIDVRWALIGYRSSSVK